MFSQPRAIAKEYDEEDRLQLETRGMSDSHRRTPIAGNTLARSEKRDKRLANRALRAAVRTAFANDIDLHLTTRNVSTTWTFDKDGKHWWPGFAYWPHKRR